MQGLSGLKIFFHLSVNFSAVSDLVMVTQTWLNDLDDNLSLMTVFLHFTPLFQDPFFPWWQCSCKANLQVLVCSVFLLFFRSIPKKY